MRRNFIEDERSKKARLAAAEASIPQWMIAKQLGVSPSALCAWRRSGMTDDQYIRVMVAIKEIKNGSQRLA